MKYIMLILLVVMAGCTQIESPLDPNDVHVAGAPNADVDIVDCSEPAYIVSISPGPDTKIVLPDDYITITFSCTPENLRIVYGYNVFRPSDDNFGEFKIDRLTGIELGTFIFISNNRNVAKLRIAASSYSMDLLKNHFERTGGKPTSPEGYMTMFIKWSHGFHVLRYWIVYPPIVDI